MTAKLALLALVGFSLNSAFAGADFALAAKTDITVGETVFSAGNVYERSEFLTYGVNSHTDRCLVWAGTPEQRGLRGEIPAGQKVTVTLDEAYNKTPNRKMIFKISRNDGNSIGGMTCSVADRAPTPVSLDDVRRFLQNQFGESADIQ